MPLLGKRLNQTEFYNQADDMLKDLESAFSVMENEIVDMLNDPANHGKTTDELIDLIMGLI